MSAQKVALVTGSTSGIGLATAHALAEKNCAVLLHGLGDSDEIETIRGAIESKYKVPVHFVGGDLKVKEEVDGLCKSVRAIYPEGIDILINNAGYCPVMPVDLMSVEDFADVMQAMVTAQFMLISHFVPDMKKKGWGRIVTTNSYAGHVGIPGLCAYVTAKHAQQGMLKSVALETAGTGVTINAVCPTGTETPMLDQNAETIAAAQGLTKEEAYTFMRVGTPTKQFCTPEQVAEVIGFLCFSVASNNMTGSSVPLDGGALAQ